MDVGVFCQHLSRDFIYYPYPILWSNRLCAQHKQDQRQMQSLVNSLKGKGLLQDADLSLGRISMHNLYCEFAVLEAKGKLVEATSIEKRRWVYLDAIDGVPWSLRLQLMVNVGKI